MSITVGMHEAKTNLSKLVGKVEAGEEVTLSRAGKPVAKIVPIQPQTNRRLGALQGQIPEFSDAEWAELDRQVRDLFRL